MFCLSRIYTLCSRYGLDLEAGAVRDNVAAGVLEPVLSKVKIIQVSFSLKPLHELGTSQHPLQHVC